MEMSGRNLVWNVGQASKEGQEVNTIGKLLRQVELTKER